MTPKKLTIHCSDSKNGVSVSTKEINEWHKARGFKKIGYHFVIDVDGSVNKGRDITEQGAHVEGHNEDNVGVCLIGKDKFTEKQWYALRDLVEVTAGKYKLKLWDIFTHSQFDTAQKQGKTCPNVPIQNILCWCLLNMPEAIEGYKL